MAVYNEILAGRYNRLFNKIFSMKGPAPSPQLASEIMPVLPLFLGNEARNLEGWQRFGMTFRFNAGGAANVSFLRIRNPANSLVVGVIEQVSLDFQSLDEWVFRIDLVNSSDFAGSVSTANSQDNRGQTQPALHLTQQQAPPATTPNFEDIHGLANTHYWVMQHQDDEITLLPDMQLTIQSETVNVTANLSVRWRERVLEESEALAKSGG